MVIATSCDGAASPGLPLTGRSCSFKPPDPNGAYGPYAYPLSGYSNVLTPFEGVDAATGRHGTNQPHLLGQDVSSGRIRMSNDNITRRAHLLPLGTPVTILA